MYEIISEGLVPRTSKSCEFLEIPFLILISCQMRNVTFSVVTCFTSADNVTMNDRLIDLDEKAFSDFQRTMTLSMYLNMSHFNQSETESHLFCVFD